MGWLTACGSGENDNGAREVYCVDEQDQVVDDDQCEEAERNGGFVGGLPFFFLLGGVRGQPDSGGETLPPPYTRAATPGEPPHNPPPRAAGPAAPRQGGP